MRTLARFAVFLLLALRVTAAADSLRDARWAQALLGFDSWSRIVRVENDASHSRYPRVLHALVFEFAGLLWFYSDVDGTQSFSLHRDRLEEEKNDFGPLLRDIEPGFKHWRVLADAAREAQTHFGLPNGCFVESIAALRQRQLQGEAIQQPRLLSYYMPTNDGLQGHTVLTFMTRTGMTVIDPSEHFRPHEYAAALADDALALARTIEDDKVIKARWVPSESRVAVHAAAEFSLAAPH